MARLVVVDNKVAIVKNIINGVLHTDTLEPIRILEKEIFYVNDGVFGKYFTEDLVDEELAYALTIIVQDNVKNKDNLLMYVDLDEVDEDLSVVDRFDGITTSEFLEELLGDKVTKSQSSEFDLETYLETHFEVVSYIERYMLDVGGSAYDDNNSAIINRHKAQGHGGLYELAKEWTDEFHTIHENTEFDGNWLDTIDEYLANKNKAV